MDINYVITLSAADRPGIIEALSNAVAEAGGNWHESRMLRLAGRFAGVARVGIPRSQAATLEIALARLESQGLELRVETGRWRVDGVIVIPRGSRLVIDAGTTLQFGPKGAIVAHGPLQFTGSASRPIVLEDYPQNPGGGSGWLGVVVLNAKQPSIWSNVIVRNTTGISMDDWELRGGVTFYQSEVQLEGCQFAGNRGEDALNLVRSAFSIRDTRFSPGRQS